MKIQVDKIGREGGNMEEILKKEADIRTQECMNKIIAVLAEYRCTLEPSITFVGNKVSDSRVLIFAEAIPITTSEASVNEPTSEVPVEEKAEEGVVS